MIASMAVAGKSRRSPVPAKAKHRREEFLRLIVSRQSPQLGESSVDGARHLPFAAQARIVRQFLAPLAIDKRRETRDKWRGLQREKPWLVDEERVDVGH